MFPRRARVNDDAGVLVGSTTHGRFYATEVLGAQQGLTPEGFLLCLGVPVARIGTQLYSPDETPITAGPSGNVRVMREEDEVFRPEFIHSFQGKPVTNDHPEDDVTPLTYKERAVGVVLNPRRGSGVQADLLIADFMIHDQNAIDDIRAGKREVSCGYDAEYVELAPGHGKQINMIGNHIALVEAGRCGGRCAIGDHKVINKGDGEMKVRDEAPRATWFKRMKDAILKKDEKQIEELVTEGENLGIGAAATTKDGNGGTVNVHVHAADEAPPGADPESLPIMDKAIDRRFKDTEEKMEGMAKDVQTMREAVDAIAEKMGVSVDAAAATEELESEMMDEAGPDVEKEDVKKAKDSALLADAYQDVVASAEILAPNLRVAAFDSKAKPAKGVDQLCRIRRNALDVAYHQPETRGVIEELHRRPLELEGMPCGAVRNLFNSVVAVVRRENNAANTRTGDRALPGRDKGGGGLGVKGPISSIAELNARNAARFAPQK